MKSRRNISAITLMLKASHDVATMPVSACVVNCFDCFKSIAPVPVLLLAKHPSSTSSTLLCNYSNCLQTSNALVLLPLLPCFLLSTHTQLRPLPCLPLSCTPTCSRLSTCYLCVSFLSSHAAASSPALCLSAASSINNHRPTPLGKSTGGGVGG